MTEHDTDELRTNERFDRITKLARSYYDVAYALITEIDDGLLLYRSTSGIELEPIKIEEAICAHTIRRGDALVIDDLTKDPELGNYPCVLQAPYFRFYAGVPLRDRQGTVIGSLCILDAKVHDKSKIDIDMLATWASLVEDELAPSVELSQQRTVSQVQAAYDPLTSFLTLNAYRAKVDEMLALVRSQEGHVDRINVRVHDLNDFNGKDRVLSGDTVLIEMALRVHGELSGERFEISRYRANGIGVTIANCNHLDALVKRIHYRLSAPIQTIFGPVTPVIQIVVTPNIEQFQNSDEIVKLNEFLFSQAPRVPGAHVVRCEEKHIKSVTRSSEVARRLRTAMRHREVQVHYQPKVGAARGQVAGLEALIRWTDDRLGPVSPVEMISVAEDYGFYETLDEFVLNSVCEDISAWRAAGVPVVPVSVNIASEHLQLPEFPKKIETILTAHNVEPALLEIEILESIVVKDMAAVIANMRHLRELGIRFAIDDFGTGYSSLSYLMDLPLDCLKIDRAFIQNIISSPKAAALAQAIVTIGHEAGMTVIAEGVEDLAQFLVIRAHDCDMIQGYFFSKPLPAAEVLDCMSRGGQFTPNQVNALFGTC